MKYYKLKHFYDINNYTIDYITIPDALPYYDNFVNGMDICFWSDGNPYVIYADGVISTSDVKESEEITKEDFIKAKNRFNKLLNKKITDNEKGKY